MYQDKTALKNSVMFFCYFPDYLVSLLDAHLRFFSLNFMASYAED
jgi:hypothetical protein